MERFTNYVQWDGWQQSQQAKNRFNAGSEVRRGRASVDGSQPAVVKKKLSYTEAREFATIEERITTAEQELHAKRAALEDPSVQSDGHRLQSICAQLEEVENNVDKLYARWAELEQKQGSAPSGSTICDD